MEKMVYRHQQELAEVKHNADLLMMELRQTMEAEKQKVLADFKKQAEIEKHKAVAECKKKQWCAHCGKEAIFYCCWNTSYCDYPCQVCLQCGTKYIWGREKNQCSEIYDLHIDILLLTGSPLAISHVHVCPKPNRPRRRWQWQH